MRMSMANKGGSNMRDTISRLSMKYQQDREMHDELEAKYLAMIQDLINRKRNFDDSDSRAL